MASDERSAAVEAGRVAETVPWRRSLRTRLTLLTSACSAAIKVLVGVLLYLGARQILLDQELGELRNLAGQTARAVDATFDSAKISAATLAETTRADGADPVRLRALLKAVDAGNPNIVGAMLILERGALKPQDAAYSWYAREVPGGFFEQPMVYPGYDYHDQFWWPRTLAERRPWWGEPYRNAATGNVLFSTYNYPIFAGDRTTIVGMDSVDVPVAHLHAVILGPEAPGGRAAAFLISPQHRFVVHPDSTLEGRSTFEDYMRAHGPATLPALATALREHRHGEARYRDRVANESRWIVLEPVGDSGWTVGITVTDADLLHRLRNVTLVVIGFGLAAMMLALLGLHVVARRVTDPLLALTETASHFGEGEFDRPLPHTQRTDEVGVLARAFDHARRSIKEQLVRIEQMSAARQKLESELSIAREIQLAMVSPSPAMASGGRRVDAHALLEPARAVGGDFYTFLQRDHDVLWFAIGDVSDKGIPAALFMARVVTMLEIIAQMGDPPDEALRLAAVRLSQSNDACMFATTLCGILDVRTGALAIASAGHDPPLLRRADGVVEALDVPTSGPLGFDVADSYPLWHIRLQPGDALVTYTDGVTEAFNASRQAFGMDRLQQAVAATDGGARAICDTVLAAVHRFADGEAPSDDITLLVLAYAEDAERGERHMHFEYELPAAHDRLPQLLDAADLALGDRAGTSLRGDVRLVLEELVCNTIEHGKSPDGTTVRIHVAMHDLPGDAVEIVYRDGALRFDPLTLPPPSLDADILERPTGGLGVHLIREIARELSYSRDGACNVLRVVLAPADASGKGPP